MYRKLPRLVLNFFSSGEKMKTKKKVSQKRKEELKIIERACEMERNFQKAVDMADGFPPPKLEEDFKFLENGFFMIFFLPKKNESRNNLYPRLPTRHPREKIFRKNLFLPYSLPQQWQETPSETPNQIQDFCSPRRLVFFGNHASGGTA